MKHITTYGSGIGPSLLVADSEVISIIDKFRNGQEIEIKLDGETTFIKGKECWAVNVKDFPSK